MSGRRGGIPGPESRTGLVRPPAMSEAEFERRQAAVASGASADVVDPATIGNEPEPTMPRLAVPSTAGPSPSSTNGRSRATRSKPAKPRRVQRMFALEEELDKKLWLYAIHVGKDRSEVVNDLLRPIVASMVLYDSRDRRGARTLDQAADRGPEGEGEAA
jgi:hypothetical protein